MIYSCFTQANDKVDLMMIKFEEGKLGDGMSRSKNPFAMGSAESLTDLLVSHIPKPEDNRAIFARNAISMATVLISILVEKRNLSGTVLNLNVVRKTLDPRKFTKLINDESLSEETRDSLKSFLGSVGWSNLPQTNPLAGQSQSFVEQYCFAQEYLLKAINNLSSSVKH